MQENNKHVEMIKYLQVKAFCAEYFDHRLAFFESFTFKK